MNRRRVMFVLPLPGGCLSVAKQMLAATSEIPGISVYAFDTINELKKIGSITETERLTWSYVKEKFAFAMKSAFETIKPDLFLSVAFSAADLDVLDYIKKRSVPTAHWLIEDFRLAPASPMAVPWIDVAAGYDYLFSIQRGGFDEAAKSTGAQRCHYLPLGCNPSVHKKIEPGSADQKIYGSDVAFVGAPYPNRVKLFSTLSHLDLGIWGAGWLSIKDSGWGQDEINGQLRERIRGDNRWIEEDEANLIYNASKIVLNPHSSLRQEPAPWGRDFLNPRLFAVAGSSAFQITDHREPLNEAFEIGEEIAVYHDTGELLNLIGYYLNEPRERMEIGRRANLRAYAQHTYRHRIERILSIIF